MPERERTRTQDRSDRPDRSERTEKQDRSKRPEKESIQTSRDNKVVARESGVVERTLTEIKSEDPFLKKAIDFVSNNKLKVTTTVLIAIVAIVAAFFKLTDPGRKLWNKLTNKTEPEKLTDTSSRSPESNKHEVKSDSGNSTAVENDEHVKTDGSVPAKSSVKDKMNDQNTTDAKTQKSDQEKFTARLDYNIQQAISNMSQRNEINDMLSLFQNIMKYLQQTMNIPSNPEQMKSIGPYVATIIKQRFPDLPERPDPEDSDAESDDEDADESDDESEDENDVDENSDTDSDDSDAEEPAEGSDSGDSEVEDIPESEAESESDDDEPKVDDTKKSKKKSEPQNNPRRRRRNIKKNVK